MCCPPPQYSVIRPVGLSGKLRNMVKAIMFGEILVCVLHMMIFDIGSGFMHSISVWIDFISYSTMNWCNCIIFIISAGLDLMTPLMGWSRSDNYQNVINSHWLSRFGFWFMIAFFCVKIVIGALCFYVWREDHKRTHGHAQCCRPVVPPAVADGSVGRGSSLNEPLRTDTSDDEQPGMRRNNNPLPFAGSGVQIGSGGGGYANGGVN